MANKGGGAPTAHHPLRQRAALRQAATQGLQQAAPQLQQLPHLVVIQADAIVGELVNEIGIIAYATIHIVGSCAAIDDVIAADAIECVLAAKARQGVDAGAAGEGVGDAAQPGDRIRAAGADDLKRVHPPGDEDDAEAAGMVLYKLLPQERGTTYRSMVLEQRGLKSGPAGRTWRR